MKLKSVQVKNFRSVEDSNEFSVGDITCLVGKNEAGKTAILWALHGINPQDESFKYDKTVNYPRRFLTRYDERHPDGKADVCVTVWGLDENDKQAIEIVLGPRGLTDSDVIIYAGYGGQKWTVPIDAKGIIKHLCRNLDSGEKKMVQSCATTQEVARTLLANEGALTDNLKALKSVIDDFRRRSAHMKAIDILSKRVPKFLYFSNYSRMSGAISVDQLAEYKQNNRPLEEGDALFLDFLDFAGTNLEKIRDAKKHEELRANLESAAINITDQIFEYWSQNHDLEVVFNVDQGKPQDPAPFNSGQVIRALINKQRVTVPFSERSAGFVWFFSFFVHFSQMKKNVGKNLVILLDEPGLSLHAKAQQDLLRYMQEKLLPDHQIIYSTHSPFMVMPDHFDTVRIVEDIVESGDGNRPKQLGTKVIEDVLQVGKDTIFPLQAALGYDIAQTLFIGQNVILVEGPSDLLYFQALSAALQKAGKPSLDKRWVICPAGGLSNIAQFVRLFMSREKRNIVAVTDYVDGVKREVNKIRQIEEIGGLFHYANFCEKDEADVEDMFALPLYLKIVNGAYGLNDEITEDCVNRSSEKRNVRVIEKCFPESAGKFDHYKPALWLLGNPKILDSKAPDVKKLWMFLRIFSPQLTKKSSINGDSNSVADSANGYHRIRAVQAICTIFCSVRRNASSLSSGFE